MFSPYVNGARTRQRLERHDAFSIARATPGDRDRSADDCQARDQ